MTTTDNAAVGQELAPRNGNAAPANTGTAHKAGEKNIPNDTTFSPLTVTQAATKLLASLGMATAQPVQKPSHFNRSHLPSPESFWAAHGVNLQTKKGWVSAKCIFHEDTHPSMSVEATSGAFYCHSCGVKGGDVLAAHRLLTGCDFMTAAKELGAWEKK